MEANCLRNAVQVSRSQERYNFSIGSEKGDSSYNVQLNQIPLQDEVLILGGGVAGCAASIALARKGRRVTLIEREPTPRHKVCGEFLSGEALEDLHRSASTWPRLAPCPSTTFASPLPGAPRRLRCLFPQRR
jgi:hypothetical protein